METRLFIIGVIMLVWAGAAKLLKRKNLLKNKTAFTILHTAFAAITAFLALWLYDFVSTGGDMSALVSSPRRTIFKIVVIAGLSLWALIAALRAKESKILKIFDKDYEWADTIYFSALLAAFVMFFFIQAFQIPSASMERTLMVGDHLFVNKFTYGFRIPLTQIRFLEFNKPSRGDIIVFQFPAKDKNQINCGGPQYGRDYVKRVVAVAGETVQVKDGQLYVNGTAVPNQGYEVYSAESRYSMTDKPDAATYQKEWEARDLEKYYGILLRDQFGPVKVPEGAFFAMGDNRDQSCDSRFWGPVPRANIKGKVWFVHWPLSRIGFPK